MPITFQPVSSAAASLRSEPLLSPPRSHTGSEDVPFKADDSDQTSLSMKKGRSRRRSRQLPFGESAVRSGRHSMVTRYHNSRKPRKPGPACSFLPLRKSRSQPSIHSRSVTGSVELLSSRELRARRWTVPSKASSTRALATVVPLQEVADRRPTKKSKSSLSPAMITLRRATTAGSQRRLSLTSFPPPKFGRRSSGFLSTIFNTITTGHHDATSSFTNAQTNSQKASFITSSSGEVRPATSTIAPPVRTEVVALDTPVSFPGQVYTPQPGRRCSTRYISDDGVYEIIWDQSGSTTTSEGAAPSPQSREWALGRRGSGDTEPVERRLSRALIQSRRTSLQGAASRRGSYWPTSETTYAQGLLDLFDSPKLARLARETAFRNLPRSRASKTTLAPEIARMDITQQMVVEPLGQQEEDQVVDFFPPFQSRLSMAGSTKLHDPFPRWAERGQEAHEHLCTPVPGSPGGEAAWSRRSSYGSMIGISRHIKRRSVSAGPHSYLNVSEGCDAGNRSSCRSYGKGLDDDTAPLLGAT
ncbi:hypothetical protein A1O3_07072 [Capronia epimyces CBS 606.96]|uniref:Uncharacterized protein n=1 Tax=Capronia epimyces CBS 606.96 TaxID=1182542 RepID=W9XKQ0_9EURO|nr:uncharacterized protein A1O3_07072 [Capronia epimyces CBS 606.96]EXJ80788.1 hypothetical protein A1O3_07072 [Capronia epimyces CBS 606.96]